MASTTVRPSAAAGGSAYAPMPFDPQGDQANPYLDALRRVGPATGTESGLVAYLAARGEHQHGRRVAGGTQALAHLEPVEARHEHVEHDRVDALLGEQLERLYPFRRDRHVVALERQRAAERLADGGLVVDHEHAHRRSLAREAEKRLNGT